MGYAGVKEGLGTGDYSHTFEAGLDFATFICRSLDVCHGSSAKVHIGDDSCDIVFWRRVRQLDLQAIKPEP